MIEMLVVLAIASVLLSGTLVLLQGARAKARDATREQHIKTLQSALSLYANNTGRYPLSDSETVLTGSDAVSVALITSDSIPQIPRDPLNQGNYQYSYISADSTTYTLFYYLETDSVPGKPAGENSASP